MGWTPPGRPPDPCQRSGAARVCTSWDERTRARRLSQATLRVARQNLAWAFGYNALGVPLAAGALFPAFGLLLSPLVAAAAMSLSSLSVLANSLRLRKVAL